MAILLISAFVCFSSAAEEESFEREEKIEEISKVVDDELNEGKHTTVSECPRVSIPNYFQSKKTLTWTELGANLMEHTARIEKFARVFSVQEKDALEDLRR